MLSESRHPRPVHPLLADPPAFRMRRRAGLAKASCAALRPATGILTAALVVLGAACTDEVSEPPGPGPVAAADVVNQAPTATADSYDVDEGDLLYVPDIGSPDVLSNDSDPESDPLHAELVGGPAIGWFGGSSGTLNADGSFTYGVSENLGGLTDSFTYRACDVLDACSDPVTVTITVHNVNDAPIGHNTILRLAGGPAEGWPPATTFPINLLGTDSYGQIFVEDEDGLPADELDFGTLSLGSPGFGTIEQVYDTEYLAYHPSTDFIEGTTSFTWHVCDTSGACTASMTVEIVFGNEPPAAVADSYTTDEDVPLVRGAPGLLANDPAEPDGDPITLSITSPASHGTAVLNGSTGGFTYTPDADWYGADAFDYQVCDDPGALLTPSCVTATVSLTVNSVNDLPAADAGGPYTVDEGAVTLDGSGSTDPDGSIVLYEWDFDGNGTWDASGTTATTIHLFDDGTYTVALRVTDDQGATDTETTTVNAAQVPPLMSLGPGSTPVQSVQYSDGIVPVQLVAYEAAFDYPLGPLTTQWRVDGGAFQPGLPGALAVSAASCHPGIGFFYCTWTLTGTADSPPGVYVVRATVADKDGAAASFDVTVTVVSEDGMVGFDAGNPVAVQVNGDGLSPNFDLAVEVVETSPDLAQEGATAAPGDPGNADVRMLLQPVGPGSQVTGSCLPGTVTGSGYDAALPVTCSFNDVPVGTYTVSVADENGYYTLGGEDVLVVFDPSLGFTTGGGSFLWPGTADPAAGYAGDRTSFGYTMKYNKKATSIQGGLLLIRHLRGGTIYRLQSNALYGLALGEGAAFEWASFSGKGTYLEPGWPEPEGNYEFIAYVEDHGTPGAGVDGLWLEVHGRADAIQSSLSMTRPADGNVQLLQRGNIVVPQTTGPDNGGGGRGRKGN